MRDSTLFKTVLTPTGERYEVMPHFASKEDVPRLSRQNNKILEMLRSGPATNHRLVTVALKYTSRISEIRAWLEANEGKTIHCEHGRNGLTTYSIQEKP